MASNEYHFITHWRMQSTVDEISAILGNGLDLVRWWPAVYLKATELEPGDARGVGRVIDVHTTGWLPYTLRWQFRITEVRQPYGFSLEASGDFVGRGIWTFAQDGDWVDLTYDWKIRADKPLLRYFSFIMKPFFSANHHWAMRKGEESLELELARQHAPPAEQAIIPAPPPPTTITPVPVVIGAAGVLAGVWLAYRLLTKGNRDGRAL